MDWKECEKEFIRKVEADKERAISIVKRAMQRKNMLELIKVSEENVSFIVEGYYEVIKELLVAYLLNNGLRSKNHQCLISYFYMNNKDYEYEANLISQMSYLRNRLNYYGESIPLNFYNKNGESIKKIIDILTDLIEK